MFQFVQALGAIAKAIPELKGICEKLIVVVKDYRANRRRTIKDEIVDSRIDSILARVRNSERK